METNFPIRYFSFSGIKDFPAEILEKALEYFNNEVAVKSNVSGKTGIEGLKIDFCNGLRIKIPAGKWWVTIGDAETGDICFSEEVSETILVSLEKYYVCWQIEIKKQDELVFVHRFYPDDQIVHFIFPSPAIGDTVALLPYIEAFRDKWHCRVSCQVPTSLKDVVHRFYPDFDLCDCTPNDVYAVYYLGAWINMPFCLPDDARVMPMEQIGQYILGINEQNVAKHITFKNEKVINEPYVCIAVQASTTTKTWLNPDGWEKVVSYLKKAGYRVLCIDKEKECSGYGITVRMPEEAEDFTGDIPLLERMKLLSGAAFFIGIGSGLSWLAYWVDCPTILISGFSFPWYEFYTPYRVFNQKVCHGCFNDARVDYSLVNICPEHHGTDRMYECSKKISAQQVITMIEKLISDMTQQRYPSPL